MSHVALYAYELPRIHGDPRRGLIVQAGTSFGDIAPLPGFSRESFDDAKEEALRLLAQLYDAKPTLPSVRFGFACALAPEPKPLRLAVAALETHRPGFQSLKLKLGALSLNEALAKIRAAPLGVQLRLDFNRMWPLKRLLLLAEQLDPTRIEYLEEPTWHWSDLLEFSHATKLPIALDESLLERPLEQLPTLKALVVKPTVLRELPKAPQGVELVFSSAYESGVGILHLATLAAQWGSACPHGLDPYTHLASDVLRRRPVIADGFLTWDGGPLELEMSCLTRIG